MQKVQSGYQQQQSYERGLATCEFPLASKDEELVAITSYEAGTLSDAALGSRNLSTETSELRIEAGEKPLYIVVSSYEPIIWRVTGHVERVAHFFAASSAQNVGVAGLPRAAVTLRPNAKCLGWVSYAQRGDVRRKAETLARLVGTSTARVLVAYQLNGAALPADAVEADKWVPLKERPDLLGLGMSDYGLQGVDPEAFEAFARFNPGGVVHVDPKAVVASGTVEAYDVLPEWAGLLQLMKQGAVKRGYLEFTVTKPIPRFPANFDAQFVLQGDIPVPDGAYGSEHIFRVGKDGAKKRVAMPRPSLRIFPTDEMP
jgi:hypothetical protein